VREEERIGLDHADFVGDEDGIEEFADLQERDLLAMRFGEAVGENSKTDAAPAKRLQHVDGTRKNREVLLTVVVVARGALDGDTAVVDTDALERRAPHAGAQAAQPCL